MLNIYAFGDTLQTAPKALRIAWEFVKENYQQEQWKILTGISRKKLLMEG